MGLNLSLAALSVPLGTEFPGTVQENIILNCQYIAVVGGETFSGINFGPTEPAPEDRDKPWFKTDNGGNPIGWFAWDGSAWASIPVVLPSGATGARPSAPADYTEYFDTSIGCAIIYYGGSWHTLDGVPGDIKYVLGTDLATVLVKNPGWIHYEDGVGRVFAGAASDGSNAETNAGADSITLTEAQMPEHTHEDIVLTGSDADNGDAGNFVITAATSSIGTRTIAASQTGPKGGSDSVDMRQATRYMFALYKL